MALSQDQGLLDTLSWDCANGKMLITNPKLPSSVMTLNDFKVFGLSHNNSAS